MWFICVEVAQETSAPSPKKILDPPLKSLQQILLLLFFRVIGRAGGGGT